MGKVLSIVYRIIATHLTRKAGYTKATARLLSPWEQQSANTRGCGL